MNLINRQMNKQVGEYLKGRNFWGRYSCMIYFRRVYFYDFALKSENETLRKLYDRDQS